MPSFEWLNRKRGKNEKESAINLPLSNPSDHSILSFIISSFASALYLCLPSPFAPLSHLQSRLDVWDGSPFSSVPSSQTNISLLSTLFLLLCRPSPGSSCVSPALCPSLPLFIKTYLGDLTRVLRWRRFACENLLPSISLHCS